MNGVTVAAAAAAATIEVSFHLHVSSTIMSEDAGEIQMNFLIRCSLITTIHITVRAYAWVSLFAFVYVRALVIW